MSHDDDTLATGRPRRPSTGADDALDGAATGDIVLYEPDGPLTVELLADGRLRAARERTREILRDRLHHAEALHTGPGWALLRTLGTPRESTREEAETNREVVLAGNLGESSISLIDVIGFLASGQQTGTLTVASGETKRAIFMLRGDVVGAQSNAPEDHIGEFLVRRGKITRQQLAAVIQTKAARVGRACVDAGFVSAHELWSMVQAQHTEIFDHVMTTEAGLWTFARLAEDELASSPVHMPTQGLLMESLRKVDEMRLYREVVRSSACLVKKLECDDVKVRRLREDVAESAVELYDAMDAPATILQLMRKSGRSEFDATRLVYHLARAKLVEVLAPDNSAMRVAAHELITKTKAHDVVVIYSMALREMFDELGKKNSVDALHAAARDFLDDPAAQIPALLRAVKLRPDGSVDEIALEAGLQKHPIGSLKELCEALDELLFFLLFQTTEMLGRRRRDDLARRVKMIHRMLAERAP